MIGILVGIACAGANALSSHFAKVLSQLHPFYLSWIRVAVAIPVLALVVTVFDLWSVPPLSFFLLIGAFVIPFEVLLQYTHMYALRLSPISLVEPVTMLSTLFLIPLGIFFLGESITVVGVAGVLLILCGTLIVSRHQDLGFILSLVTRLREPGMLLALASALCGALAVTGAKFSFTYTAPITAAFYIMLGTGLILFPIALRYRPQSHGEGTVPNARLLALLGGTNGLTIMLHYIGLALMPAAYFLSLKRLSALINVLMGKAIFNEEHFWARLGGAFLIVIGVFLITAGVLFF